jgi:fructose-6-phosphate aldolase 2
MGVDGVKVAKEIHDIYTKNGMDAGLLCASFKNSQQVLELAEYGVRAATVGPDVILNFVKNAAITSAVEDFIRDFEGLTGPGKTMSDC